MAISFSCGGCGKAFTTSDELAGKNVSCKSCGRRMRVPESPVEGGEPRDAPAPADRSPESLYDLAEIQTGSPLARPEPLVTVVVSKETSKRRSTRRKKGSSDREGAWRDVAYLTGGVVSLGVVFFFIFFVDMSEFFDFGGRNRARKFHEQVLKLEDELYECVHRCGDEASAEKNAPRMNEILDRIDKLLADYQAHRAGESDIFAVENEFKKRHQLIEQRLNNEINNKQIWRLREGGGALVSEGNLLKIDLNRIVRLSELKSPSK